jgi:DNA-binding transcriptional ArsR family regulator
VTDAGRNAFDGLDRVFHERARLSILTALSSRPEGLVFADLKEACGLTDGNLSRHLQCLRDAGVVELWKRAHGPGRPQTLCRVTPDGRKRFLVYLDALEEVVRAAAKASRKAVARPRADPRGGLAPA